MEVTCPHSTGRLTGETTVSILSQARTDTQASDPPPPNLAATLPTEVDELDGGLRAEVG